MKDKIDLVEVMEKHLNQADIDLEHDATALVREKLPDEAGYGRYLQRNLQMQEQVNTLKLGIQTQVKRLIIKRGKEEARVRDELKEEGFRAAEERTSMCHRDARYTDLSEEILDMEALYSRMDSLEWMLKTVARVVTR
jgi:hypothetical protein